MGLIANAVAAYRANRMRGLILLLLAVYLFIYVWAVPMLMLSLVPRWGTWMGGFLLILQGSIVGLWLIANGGWRGALAAGSVAALAWAVEHIGVTTGVPFGRYRYTDVLGFKIAGVVPLPIPFAWLLVVPAAMATAITLGARRRRSIIVIAALLAFGLDLLLEPVAAYVVDYWRWIDRGPYYGVPTANFMAWSATALVLTLIAAALAGRRIVAARVLPMLPALLYFLNLAQFTLVDLARGYPFAALIGAGLLLGMAWRRRATIRTLWRSGRLLPLAVVRSYLRSES